MISIILPAYNAELYIKEAIQSMLNQTIKDFELILIDDGSTDNTLKIMKSFSDKRIQIISRENKGLISSLNEGLDVAKYDLIARMDADDISLPKRFETQLKILKKDSVIACGTSYTMFKDNKSKDIFQFTEDKQIKAIQLMSNSLMHPSIMMKKTDLRYDPKYLHLEDYKFFFELGKEGELRNTKDFLLKRRIHSESICAKNHIDITNGYKATLDLMIKDLHNSIGMESEQWELDLHTVLMSNNRLKKHKLPKEHTYYYLHKLINHNPHCKNTLKKYIELHTLPKISFR